MLWWAQPGYLRLFESMRLARFDSPTFAFADVGYPPSAGVTCVTVESDADHRGSLLTRIMFR